MKRLMSKRADVYQIAIQVAGIVDTEIDDIKAMMEEPEVLLSRAQANQMKMLNAIFKMTSLSTLMQAAELAINMDEGE
jgi:hypothetical protein